MAKRKEKIDKSVALADKLFPDEENLEIEVIDLPPDQRRLHTETYDFSVSTLVDYLDKGHVFVPDFQRDYVWTIQQASRLIESLIIQCPIPVLYFSQTKDERLAVVDGNQRTNSILKYVKNEFALKGLTAYPELMGLRFSDLDSRIKRHLLNRTLRCISILKETHPQVQFDVFERLNTGSNPLNPQELRHGLYYSPFMEMLTAVARSKEFLSILPKKFHSRMKAEELVLRYFAIANDFADYHQPVSSFLNNYSKKHMAAKESDLTEMKSQFMETLELVKTVFGSQLLFKGPEEVGMQSFYVALFDAQMVAVNGLSAKKIEQSKDNKKKIQEKYKTLFSNVKFLESITKATPNKNNLKYRVDSLKAIF